MARHRPSARDRPTSSSWPFRSGTCTRCRPTSADSSARAVALFNASEHPKTLAGVIRSLGAPYVRVGPSHDDVVVDVLVAWELCWYRFEADLEGDIVTGAARAMS